MSYNFTECKPLDKKYSKKELIKLEHEWRLKLKKSGFQDVEMWDNKPRIRKKRVIFIKGHIRWGDYKTVRRFVQVYQDTEGYFSSLATYANHCPTVLEKYRAIIQEFAVTGKLKEAIQNHNPEVSPLNVWRYMYTHNRKILDFATKFNQESEEEDNEQYKQQFSEYGRVA
jgi:hypothetical protein